MLPRVILYNAVSLDGRFDWFTPDIGRFYELASRWQEDATLVGSNTILAAEGANEDEEPSDPPQSEPDDHRPLLVVPDSRGRVRSWHFLRKQPYWRDAVALCSHSTPKPYFEYLEQQNIDRIVAGDDHVDLRAALEELNVRYGVQVVRADSGGTLNGALLRAGLVHEVSVLIHPSLVGGTTPQSIFRASDLASADGVLQLRLAHVEQLEGDLVWLRYEVIR
jgi:2,5-diamino-6-(ribosylamino)-4(3H)-pyrimidinone 5'-phosphate reductase